MHPGQTSTLSVSGSCSDPSEGKGGKGRGGQGKGGEHQGLPSVLKRSGHDQFPFTQKLDVGGSTRGFLSGRSGDPSGRPLCSLFKVLRTKVTPCPPLPSPTRLAPTTVPTFRSICGFSLVTFSPHLGWAGEPVSGGQKPAFFSTGGWWGGTGLGIFRDFSGKFCRHPSLVSRMPSASVPRSLRQLSQGQAKALGLALGSRRVSPHFPCGEERQPDLPALFPQADMTSPHDQAWSQAKRGRKGPILEAAQNGSPRLCPNAQPVTAKATTMQQAAK